MRSFHMTPKEVLEDDLRIANSQKNSLKSDYQDKIEEIKCIRLQIEKLKPSRDAITIMGHVGNDCKLLKDQKQTYGCEYEIDVLIPNWVHDEHGYRALDSMTAIHRMGYCLGGIVSDAPHQVELRFFKVK